MKPNKDILNLANKLLNDKWMVLPSVHKTMCDNIKRFLEGGDYPSGYVDTEKKEHGLDKPFDDRLEEVGAEEPSVAIVEVNGVLMKHPSMFDMLLGAMDIDTIYAALQNAVEDDSVGSIVMWFNSPGGVTTGIEELGRYIAKCPKPTYGFSDSMCASAAYWLASQCDEMIVTPSSVIGSVGVFALVLNEEEAMRIAGVKIEALYSGKYKLMGHTFHALTAEERQILQLDVDKQHTMFKEAIKSRRPEISDSDMEGLTYEGKAAVEKHYADATVDSLEELLERLGETMNKDKDIKASEPTVVPSKVEAASIPTIEVVATPVEVQAVSAESKPIPGLPGVNEAKGDGTPDPENPDRDTENQDLDDKGNQKYQEEECICEKCGQKVAKKSKEDEDEIEEAEDDAEEEAEEKPVKKMEDAPAFVPSLDIWKSAISNLQADHGQMTMKRPDENLVKWQEAKAAFQNQKN